MRGIERHRGQPSRSVIVRRCWWMAGCAGRSEKMIDRGPRWPATVRRAHAMWLRAPAFARPGPVTRASTTGNSLLPCATQDVGLKTPQRASVCRWPCGPGWQPRHARPWQRLLKARRWMVSQTESKNYAQNCHRGLIAACTQALDAARLRSAPNCRRLSKRTRFPDRRSWLGCACHKSPCRWGEVKPLIGQF